jgi:DNA-binding MarR family transcriptional regulator
VNETGGPPLPDRPDGPVGRLDRLDRLDQVLGLSGLLYRRTLRAVERTAPAQGLSVGVRAVLALLRERGPLTVPELGRAQEVSRQFAQRTVNEAAARHFVESVPNPAHRRSPLIRLTESGRAAVTAVTEREREALRSAAGDLTDAEVEACLKVLNRLLGLFGEARGDTG